MRKITLTALMMLLSLNVFSENLKITTFNINALVPIYDSSRVELICQSIKKSSSDVILLQEVWIKKYRKLLTDCGYNYIIDMSSEVGLFKKVRNKLIKSRFLKSLSWLLNFFIPKDYGFDKGLLILSKIPFDKEIKPVSFEFQLNGSEEYYLDGEIAVNKGAIGTFITVNNKRVFIVNTHLVAKYKDDRYSKQRVEQLIELNKWVHSQSAGGAFIIGGDFNFSTNSSKDSQFWKKIKQDHWPKKVFNEVSNIFIENTHKEGILDRIFGSHHLIPVSGGVVFKKTTKPLSDHYGFEAIFSFN